MQLAQFLEYLEDRAGDTLRAVEWYREGQAELIYLRDDLDVEDVKPRADEIHELLTKDGRSDGESKLRELGDRLATVNLHEEAVLIHLPVNENYGVVVGLDSEDASSLHQFVNDCRDNLIDFGPSKE